MKGFLGKMSREETLREEGSSIQDRAMSRVCWDRTAQNGAWEQLFYWAGSEMCEWPSVSLICLSRMTIMSCTMKRHKDLNVRLTVPRCAPSAHPCICFATLYCEQITFSFTPSLNSSPRFTWHYFSFVETLGPSLGSSHHTLSWTFHPVSPHSGFSCPLGCLWWLKELTLSQLWLHVSKKTQQAFMSQTSFFFSSTSFQVPSDTTKDP